MAYGRRDQRYDERPHRNFYSDNHESMYDEQREAPRHRGSSGRTPPHDRSRTPPRESYGRSDDYPAGRRGRQNGRESDPYSHGQPSSRSDYRGSYRDRDNDGYRSPGYDSRSRSRSPSRRRSRSPYYGGPPSREVMMDGLPLDMTEEDISRELKRYHDMKDIEDIRVIRDRNTKTPRGFGFLRFISMEQSKAFLERNYPSIYLGNESSNGDEQAAKVRIAYSRERDDRNRGKSDVEWTCPNCSFANFAGRKACYKCQAPFTEMAAAYSNQNEQPQFTNSGDSDASPNSTPSQFLLLRGLEPTVTEELLAKGVSKLYKPSSANPQPQQSKKGGSKVSSTTGDANLGAKDGSLRRVLLIRDRRSNESWRYGFAEFASVEDAQAALIRYNSFEKFTISSKPVTACYIHSGVFVPVFDTSGGQEAFTFGAAAKPTLRLRYWDEGAYARELVVTEPEHPVATSAEAAKSAADAAAAAAEKEGFISKEDAEARSKKRKADVKDTNKPKKATPAHLQFWSNRHAELHGGQKPAAQSEGNDNDANRQSSSTDSASVEKSRVSQQSYSDPKKMCCYLCSRQFKYIAEVNKHERLSQLHRDNLQNEELLSKAIAKLEKAGLPVHPADETTSEYRDRAKERRAAFGSSKKVSLPMKKSHQSAPAPKESSPPPAIQPKGASLLGKMGWSAGEGLGARGTGMTAPIETNLYASGVGLGAQGGKVGDALEEAGRNTKSDYAGFVERAKDKAKERYEKMA